MVKKELTAALDLLEALQKRGDEVTRTHAAAAAQKVGAALAGLEGAPAAPKKKTTKRRAR